MATAPDITAPVAPARRRGGWATILRQAASLPRGRFGLAVLGLVLAVAVVGPFVAPHSATARTVSHTVGPRMDTSSSAKTSWGKARSTSTVRMMIPSGRPCR